MFFVVTAGTVFAQEEPSPNQKSDSIKTRGQKTYFSGFESKNVPMALRKTLKSMTGDNLDRLKGCFLMKEPDSMVSEKSPGCFSRDCVIKTAGEQDAEKILYASITELRRNVRTQIDKEGYGQYLLQDNETVKYQVTMVLMDGKGDVLISLKEKTTGRTLKRTLKDMVAKLAPYFEPVVIEEPVKEVDLREEFLAGSLDYLGPINKFTNMSNGGGGITLSGGLANYIAANSIFILDVGYGYYRSEHSLVSSLQTLRLQIGGGYLYNAYGPVRINPLIGMGVHTSFVRETSGNVYTFTDTLVQLSCPVIYKLNRDYMFFLSPALTLFFEDHNVGTLWSMSFGVRYFISLFHDARL